MKTLITYRKTRGRGGVANYFRVLKPFLPANIDYFVFSTDPDGNIVQNLKCLLIDYFRFKKIINNYDIIHVNPSLRRKAVIRDGLLIRASLKQGKRVVVFFRGWDESFENKIKKYWLWLFRKYYFKAEAIIVLAEKFKDSLIKMGYAGKIFVSTTVVDDSFFQSYFVKKPNSGVISILFLSRVEKAKGIYESIDAINHLGNKGLDVELFVAGDGTELESVKRYVTKNRISGITFLGYVRNEDKTKAFISNDIFLLPSHGEGMPNSLLEAMAFGLPIITRPVGGIKDFFEHGKMGFMTESFNPEILAALIEKLIYDPELRESIGKYNYEYAKEKFSATVSAKRLNSIYQEILT